MAVHVKIAVLMSVIKDTPASMAPRLILKPSVRASESSIRPLTPSPTT